MNKLVFLFSIIPVCFSYSCNHCDELAPTSCKECYQRLYGNWTLSYLATNGIDSVAYFDSLFGSQCIFWFNLYEKGTDYGPGQTFTITWGDTGSHYYTDNTYSAITDESVLPVLINTHPVIGTINPFTNWNNAGTDNWQMEKLSDTQLWLKFHNNNGHDCEMRLNK